MTDHSALRKARGAFFTPPEITRFIAEWAIRTPQDRVLEPSCGDAEFLVAAGDRLYSLGAGLFAAAQLQGVEIHEPSAVAARERASGAGYNVSVRVRDFFEVQPEQYDAVIGNPPYIRYHGFTGDARAKALQAALRHGVRLTKLTSSWAPFTVYATEFVAPGGRLGLVLPAELLAVKYAAEVRRFLLERFGSVRLVVFEALIFPGVREEVVLLLAEGQGPAEFFEVFQARDLDDLRRIQHADWIPFAPEHEEKWLNALLPTDALDAYRGVATDFENLASWGTTYLGTVTGDNRFFALTSAQVRENKLPARELRRISPPGSRHLRGLTFTETALESLAKEGRATYLFAPDPKAPSEAALRYIEAGEKLGVHRGYKCRNRTPWWRVPIVGVPDLFLTYMDESRPRLITNRAGANPLNSLYGVRLKEDRRKLGADLLPLAALNSATLLGAELVGRAYGGGLLKLEPREADRLPLPCAHLLENVQDELRAHRPQLARLVGRSRLDQAVKIVDQVILTRGLGLPFELIKALRDAREVLAGRRRTRASATR